ncbi:hypothetical protein ACLKA7_008362 [Drosophila subpalustris]
MRLANSSLSFHWALGLCLLLFWATTSTRARFIAKRETHNVDIGVAAASTTDPDIVKPSSESVNGTQATTTAMINIESLKEAEQEELTSTTSTTTEATRLVTNATEASTTPANVEAIKFVEAMQSQADEKQEPITTKQLYVENVEPLKLSEDNELKATTVASTADAQEQVELELTTASTTTTEAMKETTSTTTAATTTTTTTTERLISTQRSEDHARSMQFASSTESFTFVSPVTPMKLRPLLMTTTTKTTTTTTHTPQLLAALLHAGVTVTPSASHENAIEEEQLHPQPEKRAKFISDNSTNAQQLTLPNAAEVWSLAAMKMVPSTTPTTTATPTTTLPLAGKGTELANDIETHQDKNHTMQHKEKNLLDWQQIMMMQTSQENRTEPVMSTTLDATEAATQATTLRLEVMLNEREMETSASTAVTASNAKKTEESNMLNVTTTAVKLQDEHAPTPTTEATTEALTAKPELRETAEEGESTVTANVTAKAELTELAKLSLKAVEGAVTEAESVTATESATIAKTITTTTPASLTTAEPEIPAITTVTTTTTTGMPSALNATPNPNTNTNEMAMKATAHENNENGDKANNVDVDSGSESDDVINVLVSVSVSTTETTLAATESQPITVTKAATTTTATATAAKEDSLLTKTNMASTTTTTTTTTGAPKTTTTEEPLISLLDDSTTTTTTTASSTTTTTTETTTTTNTPRLTTTAIKSTTAEPIYSSTNKIKNNMLPVESTTQASGAPLDLPTTMLMPPHPTELDHMQQPHGNTGTDVNVIIAITVSVIGVVALILLVAFLYLMRKRQKQMSYGQRCRPVSLDAYSLDNVSVLGSVRRKGRDLRASKRTYGNAAFDDPSLRHNLLSATELGKFLERRSSIFEEFRDVPQIIARADEVPAGCEDKNRYANVIPLPETRVVLQRQGDDDKTEYINANYVRGPRDAPNYYIACQAPLESTTGDFWRMIWEQQSRVIVQATDLNENGIERCAEYLPPSVTLDNHSSYGDYQVTLKHREVKDKYAISTLMLKRVDGDECRELTHYWYKWPEAGVPLEEAPIIAMLLEARSSLKSYALEQANELKEKSSTLTLKSLETALDNSGETTKPEEGGSTSSGVNNEINGNVANKQQARSQQGPLTIHCSPGTGRTGTIIACDMAIRSLETPKRSVDIPQLVYYVRRGRASAVQTKEQYEFIYKVANMYATKITNLSNDN